MIQELMVVHYPLSTVTYTSNCSALMGGILDFKDPNLYKKKQCQICLDTHQGALLLHIP